MDRVRAEDEMYDRVMAVHKEGVRVAGLLLPAFATVEQAHCQSHGIGNSQKNVP